MTSVLSELGPSDVLTDPYPDAVIRPALPSDFLQHQLEDTSTGVRKAQKAADVDLDCQIGLNTAVRVEGRVRGPHVDNLKELFAALLYMREDGEPHGGNLVTHRLTHWPPRLHGRDRVLRRIRTASPLQ